MFRILLRSACVAGHHPVSVYESCCLWTKYGPVFPKAFRVAHGGQITPFSTSCVCVCQKNDGDVNRVQTPSVEDEQEGAAMKAEDEGVSLQQQEQEQVEVRSAPPPVKSGKESLLELLGAMKVEVTNKKKLKSLKLKHSFDPTGEQKRKAVEMERTTRMFQKAAEDASLHDTPLDAALVAAASAAASTLPNPNQAESELLRQLRQRKAISPAHKKGDATNLGVIIADMKVGKRSSRHSSSPAGQILFDDDGRGFMADRGITGELAGVQHRRSKLSGKRLNIFSSVSEQEAVEPAAEATLWDLDFAHQLCLSTNQQPRNGFEEMIQWTKEGKLWQYPINNEAGLEEEADVPFHEHVFLEKHLAEGFPRQGPVRHFMELVVAGLSRNHHLTVQQKKEHILWFQDYFREKEELLKEADVFLG